VLDFDYEYNNYPPTAERTPRECPPSPRTAFTSDGHTHDPRPRADQLAARFTMGSKQQRMGSFSSEADLLVAMQAASLATKGPDLDQTTDEVIAAAKTTRPEVDIEALSPVRPIGVGGQGGVWLSIDRSSGLRIAVKEVRKGRLAKMSMVKSTKLCTRAHTERECLLEVGDHPFITTCYACFQNEASLFFALELTIAGDLFKLMDAYENGMPEVQARFFTSCIALALRHIHAHGWVYRDIKCAAALSS
jgi:hypothetical protein